jgi:hypothetical protein
VRISVPQDFGHLKEALHDATVIWNLGEIETVYQGSKNYFVGTATTDR